MCTVFMNTKNGKKENKYNLRYNHKAKTATIITAETTTIANPLKATAC